MPPAIVSSGGIKSIQVVWDVKDSCASTGTCPAGVLGGDPTPCDGIILWNTTNCRFAGLLFFAFQGLPSLTSTVPGAYLSNVKSFACYTRWFP